ncbi:hypothetical protein OTU49_010367 [Cherax quadricarinatus]|uniref:Uncharacterized protein n=1 Tax=Cherax quadricarinatus TaxID=27406 RepID=A0AAW0YB12_CHEQU
MIKENRRIGNISAGPTSHLLEGVTWDEARRMQDASMSAATDHVILVGAASKGIIQRDFQHNAVVYKTPYAKNPFDAVTDQELEEYKELIERKQRGEPIEEIEIEKMNIMPERAMIDVVDDSMQDSTLNTTAPTSPTSDQEGETVANGDENEAHHSTVSHSSKEGSPTKDTSLTDDSISKDKKKKKKGLRTPSFLKKKKDKKKEKEAAHQ